MLIHVYLVESRHDLVLTIFPLEFPLFCFVFRTSRRLGAGFLQCGVTVDIVLCELRKQPVWREAEERHWEK
ncbi:hypothetical protein WR25_01112 [Diploscapter pachys]|uniref:Uncharacterized protein n=1 Tax=Diploscapter pachys TaxID=2018661 RepID=A0A2A2LIV3_9BILA|nr:hypothetical protein WR25_01112 [Diploscapter pachys]